MLHYWSSMNCFSFLSWINWGFFFFFFSRFVVVLFLLSRNSLIVVSPSLIPRRRKNIIFLSNNKIADININKCSGDCLEWHILLINKHELATAIVPKKSWLFETLIKFFLTNCILFNSCWLKAKESLFLLNKDFVILFSH